MLDHHQTNLAYTEMTARRDNNVSDVFHANKTLSRHSLTFLNLLKA